jgi:ADP-ribose pyrophosphatase
MGYKKWDRISTIVFKQNDYWSYMIDEYLIDSSIKGSYHYVHTNGSSMIIPIFEDGSLLLIEQFRYLNNRISLEFPCGGVPSSISYEENAVKELREETGYDTNDLSYLGQFSPYTGAADEICKVYTARQLFDNPLSPDTTEEFSTKKLTITEVQQLINDNVIWDGLTLAAWSLYQKKIGANKC